MNASHFAIWAAIALLLLSLGASIWHIWKLHIKIAKLERWAAAYVPFAESALKNQESRIQADLKPLRDFVISGSQDFNKRLIQLETENKVIPPSKRDEDDDPFNGPRSWTSQAAAAERAAGVRTIA